jgi:hypothetical protein
LPKAKPAAGAAPAGDGGPSNRTVAARPRSRGPKGSQPDGTFKKVQDMWTVLLKQEKKK